MFGPTLGLNLIALLARLAATDGVVHMSVTTRDSARRGRCRLQLLENGVRWFAQRVRVVFHNLV